MHEYTRREFLGVGAVLTTGLGVGDWKLAGSHRRAATAVGPEPIQTTGGVAPDLVVVNAKVYTVDESLPRTEAFAVKDGRFIAVGSSADIQNLVANGTVVIDGEGMTVTPGILVSPPPPGPAYRGEPGGLAGTGPRRGRRPWRRLRRGRRSLRVRRRAGVGGPV